MERSVTASLLLIPNIEQNLGGRSGIKRGGEEVLGLTNEKMPNRFAFLKKEKRKKKGGLLKYFFCA